MKPELTYRSGEKMFTPEYFKNKKALVIGAGKSGIAVANLLAGKGFRVFLSESASLDKVRDRLKDLDSSVETETGGHTDAVLSCGFAVKCPGLSHKNPVLIRLEQNGIPVFSEVEVALAFARSPHLLAVTGTNGKTTTSMMLGEIMKIHAATCGSAAFTVGNIGNPVAAAVCGEDTGSFITAELSSYQLEDSSFIKPEVSVILNITPDHLEHHGSMEAYIEAKKRIFLFQDKNCFCVLNHEDPICRKMSSDVPSEILWFSSSYNAEEHCEINAFIKNGLLVFRYGGKKYILNPPDLPGIHNMENALAAGLSALAAGAMPGEIQRAFDNFKPVEHRIEPAGTVKGIKFINDSKATNVDSVLVALKAMPAGKKTWLILGGRDKGAPYSPLVPLVMEKVKSIITTGEAAPVIEKELSSCVSCKRAADIYEACRIILASGKAGDTALFSPACSSFDCFKDYEDRGRRFKAYVKELADGERQN